VVHPPTVADDEPRQIQGQERENPYPFHKAPAGILEVTIRSVKMGGLGSRGSWGVEDPVSKSKITREVFFLKPEVAVSCTKNKYD
jgi:hypothetical protein